MVKRRRTDGVRQRRHNASAGGVGQEDETSEEVKKINDCWIFNGTVIVKTIDDVVKEIRSDVDLTGY